LLPVLIDCAVLLAFAPGCWADGARPSVWVFPSDTGDLIYGTDTNGVRINDFSECGYKRGQVALPNVTNLVDQSRWLFLHPLGGGQDDGAGINAALNFVGAFSPNSNGFRGVVCLGPGSYLVSDTNSIRLTNNGVVLKGSGSSPSSGTWLYAGSAAPYALIQVEGSGDRIIDPNTEAFLMETLVPAGSRTFRMDTTNGFHVGDSIAIH